MNGPEHYKEAEKLIDRAHDLEDQKRIDNSALQVRDERRVDFMMWRADVHSRLAAAAATIEMAQAMQADNGVQVEWVEAVT